MSPWRTAWRPSSHSGAEIVEESHVSAVVMIQERAVASPLRECRPERAKCPVRRALETFSTSTRSMSCRGSQSSAIRALKKPKPCQCPSREMRQSQPRGARGPGALRERPRRHNARLPTAH